MAVVKHAYGMREKSQNSIIFQTIKIKNIMDNITNLNQLAKYINTHEDWMLEVNDIIEKNGWTDETGEDYGICNDGKLRLSFDSNMKAVVSKL